MDLHSGTPSKPNLAEIVVSRLRREILAGELPSGTPVTEIPTAQRLNVSRVPVREALLVLEQEGLLVFGERGRAHVRTLASGEYLELYHARVPLERAAARLVAERGTDEDFAAMEAILAATRKARTLAEVSQLDLEFHDLIFRVARSPWLLRFWSRVRSELGLWLLQLQRAQQSVTRQVRESTCASHEEYIALVRARNAAGVERHIEAHLRCWLEWMPMDVAGEPPGREPASKSPR